MGPTSAARAAPRLSPVQRVSARVRPVMQLSIAPLVKQLWTVSGVLFVMLGLGMIISYPSSMLPALQSGNDTIKVDVHTASWLGSSVGVSGFVGILISSLLMERLGRRFTSVLGVLPSIAGWLLIYYSSNVVELIIGRILGGLTAGALVCLNSIIIGEYTSPQYRGMFLNLKTTAVCLGNTFLHLLGFYFHWRTVALIALAPQVVSLLIMCTWRESPAWLAAKERFEASESVFYWLRGKSEQSTKELDDMIRAQKERKNNATIQSYGDKVKEFFKKFRRRDVVQPVIIVSLGAVLLEASGRHVFPAYAPQIIGEITGDRSLSFYYTLALDLIITASAMFSSVLVKLMRRRTLLFTTGAASLAVLAAVCLYLYLVSIEVLSNTRTWIPQCLFVMYFILSNLGCTPLPLIFLGELFPLAHRGTCSAVAGVSLSFVFIVAMEAWPYLLVGVGVHGAFTAYGAVMAASLIALYYLLPETKDRTLQEIEDYFNYRSVSRAV